MKLILQKKKNKATQILNTYLYYSKEYHLVNKLIQKVWLNFINRENINFPLQSQKGNLTLIHKLKLLCTVYPVFDQKTYVTNKVLNEVN